MLAACLARVRAERTLAFRMSAAAEVIFVPHSPSGLKWNEHLLESTTDHASRGPATLSELAFSKKTPAPINQEPLENGQDSVELRVNLPSQGMALQIPKVAPCLH